MEDYDPVHAEVQGAVRRSGRAIWFMAAALLVFLAFLIWLTAREEAVRSAIVPCHDDPSGAQCRRQTRSQIKQLTRGEACLVIRKAAVHDSRSTLYLECTLRQGARSQRRSDSGARDTRRPATRPAQGPRSPKASAPAAPPPASTPTSTTPADPSRSAGTPPPAPAGQPGAPGQPGPPGRPGAQGPPGSGPLDPVTAPVCARLPRICAGL